MSSLLVRTFRKSMTALTVTSSGTTLEVQQQLGDGCGAGHRHGRQRRPVPRA